MVYFKHQVYWEELEKILKNECLRQCLLEKVIVITGARGLIGSELVDVLMYANIHEHLNCKVYAVVRKEIEARQRFADYLESEYFALVKADVNTDEIDIREDIDYFVHGASNTHPLYYADKPIETILTNTAGTNRTLQFAVRHHCKRYILLSSVEVYGENRGDVDAFTEDYCGYIDSNTLRAGYPEGKRVSEALCQAYRKEYRLNCVIPRLARCYGPGLLKEDSKALSQFITNAVQGNDVVLKSEGNQFYSYVYVADAVDAIITLIAKGKDGDAYNVVGKKSDITLAELAQMIAGAAGKKVLFEMPGQNEKEGYSKATKAIMSGEKMGRIGWESVYSINVGVKHTIRQLLLEKEIGDRECL